MKSSNFTTLRECLGGLTFSCLTTEIVTQLSRFNQLGRVKPPDLLHPSHERTHNNIRPFACNFRGADGEFACGQTFSTSSHATRHERTHTKDAPRRVAPAKKGRGLPWQDVVRALLQD
jgi:hypothetical protein